MPPKLSVPLRFVARETPVRRGEPVTVGLPWPRGAVRDAAHFHLLAPDGTPQPLQTNVLDRWPDGSVRWCLFDFLATVNGTNDGYRIEVGESASSAPGRMPVDNGYNLTINTWALEVTVKHAGAPFFLDVRHSSQSMETRLDAEWLVYGATTPDLPGYSVSENGPIRTRVTFEESKFVGRGGVRPGPVVCGHIDFFAGSPVLRFQITLLNPHAAGHPNGNWDLGNSGSAGLKWLRLGVSSGDFPVHQVSVDRRQPFQQVAVPFSLRQVSSGGDNWRSVNHIMKDRSVSLRHGGYEVIIGDPPTIEAGLRSTPILTAQDGERFLGVTAPRFWEEFPKEVVSWRTGVTLDLFPFESDGRHELQGGEQKTHTFYVAFGRDNVTDEPMVWCRSPLLCHADPEWYASTSAIPYLTPKASDPNAEYLKLVDQAIEGPDTFLHKREKIDEYGWRHFGDIYGDHEAVYWPGPEPMVSHYNNQYDCVAGFLYQFLRSGDSRWYSQGIECADHTCDIDVYHTDGDKAAYNRGLFWHTYHYAPADTGTHRGYPKSLTKGPVESLTRKMDQLGETAQQLKKSYAVGGGPSASHNYNTGLMLAYFLTGNPMYRDTAIDLARFVINMDDPKTTVFRFLSREYTGYATESGGGGYHGPGRASANSVNALLVGHQLTGEREYLEKAEQLIRRVSHPKQNLERLDLLNAELRWFYTMFLQSLGRYLDYKIELGELDRMYAYGRLTLLHYARWMAQHERPILDTPERLQYPTETWAAQDMRKVEVFQYAAKHSLGAVKEKYLERADWFFRYVERILPTFPTKSLCRPVVLMMNFGWSRAWWQQHPEATAPEPTATDTDFGEWTMFVPQKAIALKRAKRLLVAGVVGFVAALAVGVWWVM